MIIGEAKVLECMPEKTRLTGRKAGEKTVGRLPTRAVFEQDLDTIRSWKADTFDLLFKDAQYRAPKKDENTPDFQAKLKIVKRFRLILGESLTNFYAENKLSKGAPNFTYRKVVCALGSRKHLEAGFNGMVELNPKNGEVITGGKKSLL